MKLLRFLGYFSQLRRILGFGAVCRFSFSYLLACTGLSRDRGLLHLPVGPYAFSFPSLSYFEGLFTEIFFKETYSLPPTKTPIRVIDAGANIGVSLLYIKTRAPHAQVLCFEPNPAARAVLEKNIEVNGWKQDVRVLPYALGKKKGSTQFFVEKNAATSSGGSVANYLEKKNRQLDSYTVEEELLSEYIDGTIDLLKMDIEGGEFDVIEDLTATGAIHTIKEIQLEYHYIPGFFTRPLSELLTLLEAAGFHTFAQANAPAHTVIRSDTMHTYMVFAWR